jgi:hypothetical protein
MISQRDVGKMSFKRHNAMEERSREKTIKNQINKINPTKQPQSGQI